MQQYTDLMNRIIDMGEWVHNERTNKNCRVVINADMEYDFCPLVTTRKSSWKSAVAEFVGYLRGYTSAEQFRELGTTTWDGNANAESWQDNYYCQGKDDMGRVYGAQGREWRKPEYYYNQGLIEARTPNDSITDCISRISKDDEDKINFYAIDQLKKVYENLKNGIDDRGEIISFYNPGEFHMGCLRPCIHTHTFSLMNGKLDLTSYQRSCDVPLGLNFNMVQLHFFLKLMARITGNKAGTVYHKIVNAHIYEDQYDLAKVEARRLPFDAPTMSISADIQTLEDVENVFTLDHVKVSGYEHHDAIKYPLSV